MTTDTYAYAPAVQPALTWSALCDRNPSLRSWQRSAAAAGARRLSWWLQWAAGSSALRRDVSEAVGASATTGEFWEAHAVAMRQITEAYQAGVTAAAQAQERETVAARQQARATAPPPRPWGRRPGP